MALSPWPARTAVASLAAAILELGAALGEADDTVTARLGATSAALVERFAPGAPVAVKCEAVIRCAGWLRLVFDSISGNTEARIQQNQDFRW